MTNILIRLFVKDYKNTSDAEVRQRYGKFAGMVGILTNLLLFLMKITLGTIFNSISITADAVNNLSDSSSSLITLLGFKISGKPADAEHPYGHARMEYVSGLVVSLIILMLGLQLIKSSVDKIINPVKAGFSIISVVVLTLSIIIKLWQCLFYRKIGSLINSETIIATSMDSRNDIAATSAVLIAAVITHLTGFNMDGYMGAVVAVFIIISGVELVIDTIDPLLGKAPKKELVDKICKKILSYDGILGLHDLTMHSYGSGQCFATVHCEVDARTDILVSHDIIDNIERDFMKEQGIHLVIHLDPIITDDEKTNKLREMVKNTLRQISPDMRIHDFRVVWGTSHSNLIFDVVVPYNFKYKDNELIKIISDKIHGIDANYYAVVTVDHRYV